MTSEELDELSEAFRRYYREVVLPERARKGAERARDRDPFWRRFETFVQRLRDEERSAQPQQLPSDAHRPSMNEDFVALHERINALEEMLRKIIDRLPAR